MAVGGGGAARQRDGGGGAATVVWKWRFGGCPLSFFFSVVGINLTLGGYFLFGLGEGVVPGSGPGLVLWVLMMVRERVLWMLVVVEGFGGEK